MAAFSNAIFIKFGKFDFVQHDLRHSRKENSFTLEFL